jgi:predicted ribonuclease YlaK
MTYTESLQCETDEIFFETGAYRKPNRKTKRDARRNNRQRTQKPKNLELIQIRPMTGTQANVFDSFSIGQNLMLHGVAGTGKTFLAMFLGLTEVIDKDMPAKSLHIIRSTVSTRDMGFQKGTASQKIEVYEGPYSSICAELFNRGDAYSNLKQKNIINFYSTAFIRGISIDDAIIVVDECQNMSEMELHSIITRVGKNTKIMFCGDFRQDDLTSKRYNEESGITKFMKILDKMESFDMIDFKVEDIVRSGLVREYIEARIELGMD